MPFHDPGDLHYFALSCCKRGYFGHLNLMNHA